MGRRRRDGFVGKLVGVVKLLREHGDAIEADLSRYHGIDYRDRWRRTPDGRRALTLRMIYVRVRHLPVDSATARATSSLGDSNRDWSLTNVLLAQLHGLWSGKPHPWLKDAERGARKAARMAPARTAAFERAKRRAAAREAAIAAGTIT